MKWFLYVTNMIFILCTHWFSVNGVSIDDAIAAAANSSREFNFHYDSGNAVIKKELDILQTVKSWREEQEIMYITDGMQKRNALRDTNKRWTSNTIPYEIRGHFSSTHRRTINAAFSDYHKYTCLKFRPATSRDRNKIRIQNGGGCASFVGMQGGTQIVTLAKGCRIKRIIIHELGHAVGFHHEQTRPDRDRFITLQLQNVPPSVRYNFDRSTWSLINAFKVPYDYHSVMHYGRSAFSYNGKDTIIPKDSKYLNVIGEGSGLSFGDVKLLNLMYNCGENCDNKKCPGDGFVGKDCKCYCPGNPVRECSGGHGGDGGNDGGGGGGDGGGSGAGNGGGGSGAGNGGDGSGGNGAGNGGGGSNSSGGGSGGSGAGNGVGGSGGGGAGNGGGGSGGGDGGGGGGSGNGGSGSGGGGNDGGICTDNNRHCNYWLSRGFCRTNPAYMHQNCKKSCNKCSGGGGSACSDRNSNCGYWSGIGECKKNPAYMLQYCKRSCKTCPSDTKTVDCSDKNSNCRDWARAGECQKNPAYMLTNCKLSCNSC